MPGFIARTRSVPGQRVAFLERRNRRIDGVAIRMAKHHYQLRAKNGCAELQAAQTIECDGVAGHAHHKQVA